MKAPAGPDQAVTSADRYRSFMQVAIEGIWYYSLRPPVPVDTPVEEQVRLIFSNAVLDECNDAMARMYGLESASELVGSRLTDTLIPTIEGNREQVRQFILGGYRDTGTQSVERTPTGGIRYFVNSLAGVVENGFLIGAWGSQIDVTDTRRVEQQSRAAETVAALNRLAGGVAHDFNNLLTTVLTSIDMLEDVLPADHPGRHDAMEIRRAARRGAELTRQLLALSQQQVLVPRPTDINSVVRRVGAILHRTLPPSVQVEIRVADTAAVASVDSDELEQVLVNLGGYISEAVRNSGQLAIRVTRSTIDESQPAFPDPLQPGRYVTVAVTDSAPSHSPADRQHLFEPFFGVELAESASGLALATLHGFTRQTGATLVLDEPAEGRSLRIFFPLISPSQAGERRSTAAGGPGPATVLIAEDEPTVRLLMKRVLQRAGYTVLVASNGEEALEIARSHGGAVDALVTDVIMPGMGGGELSRRLRQERPGIRVLHVSGYTAGALRNSEALEDGAVFMQKPFSPRALLARLTEVLKENAVS